MMKRIIENTFPSFPELAQSEIQVSEKFAVFLRNDGIIQVEIKNGMVINLKEAEDILHSISLCSQGKKYPLLAIYGSFNFLEKEAMKLVSQHQLTLADALLTNDHWATTRIAKFYLLVFPPARPTQIFNQMSSALSWLEKFKE